MKQEYSLKEKSFEMCNRKCSPLYCKGYKINFHSTPQFLSLKKKLKKKNVQTHKRCIGDPQVEVIDTEPRAHDVLSFIRYL